MALYSSHSWRFVMTAKQLKNKLNKKTPLLMSPFGFALAACGGGGGDGGGESGSKPFV